MGSRRCASAVRNLLMVPSRGRTKGLKVTKLAKVSAIGEKDKEPQGEGRGEDREGDDLEESNDDESTKVKRKMGVDQLCAVHRWTVWGLPVYSTVLIYNTIVCTYVARSTSQQ
jgi:hypothetical protein